MLYIFHRRTRSLLVIFLTQESGGSARGEVDPIVDPFFDSHSDCSNLLSVVCELAIMLNTLYFQVLLTPYQHSLLRDT